MLFVRNKLCNTVISCAQGDNFPSRVPFHVPLHLEDEENDGDALSVTKYREVGSVRASHIPVPSPTISNMALDSVLLWQGAKTVEGPCTSLAS